MAGLGIRGPKVGLSPAPNGSLDTRAGAGVANTRNTKAAAKKVKGKGKGKDKSKRRASAEAANSPKGYDAVKDGGDEEEEEDDGSACDGSGNVTVSAHDACLRMHTVGYDADPR